jgi:hypothetical protein
MQMEQPRIVPGICVAYATARCNAPGRWHAGCTRGGADVVASDASVRRDFGMQRPDNSKERFHETLSQITLDLQRGFDRGGSRANGASL